ncbi:signal peptidase I [Mycoplasmopsis anatis]|uniref:signal peptidase I n=1 Tax=Mycoplasmopsis anatis TaxID=171279 RepID=UPI001C7C8F22|nr:signal peptidase I [Mycoplasmopsis anatis]MBW0594314.1 signal peptidase I [Mycoplasmopsis anatis]MBW0595137.1 signal peptidase I [Mycoplasmopsis anatis]MBW0597928.1 signal peptidase I [Mycoplasmopsis anatis]MBW0598693.1 signal peptidase I [Mycoplasmopsis anatis]MBW0599774.1 signal peptidase I [Mycoplasmopsis anatis]
MISINILKNHKINKIILLITFLILVFVIIISVFFIKFMIIKIDGDSMIPHYENNSIHLVWKTKNFSNLDDVLINKNDTLIIKKLVGLSGDHIFVSNNKILLNGQDITNYFIIDNFITDEINIIVPNDSCFVLGTNLSKSNDSLKFGFLAIESMIGKVLI